MMEVFTIPAKTVTTTMGFYNYCYLQWSSSFKSMCIFAQKKKKSPNQNQSFLKFSFSQNKLFTFSVSFCIEALFWKNDCIYIGDNDDHKLVHGRISLLHITLSYTLEYLCQ